MENGGFLGGTKNHSLNLKSLQSDSGSIVMATPIIKHKPPLGNIHPSSSKDSIASSLNCSPRQSSTPRHRRDSLVRRGSTSSISSTKSSSIVDDLLESSFTEWLTQKESEIRVKKREAKEREIKKEEEQTTKMVEREERSRDVVMKWRQGKEKVLQETRRIKAEKEREEKEKEERLLEKVKQSTESAQKWRQEKTSALKEKSKQEKKKNQEIETKKQEETQIQMISAEKAFKIWRQKKDAYLKESLTKQNKENKDKTESEMIHKQERRKQATSIYDAWKQAKDRQIKDTKQLYTYNPNPRQPPKGHQWKPARSIQYSYPTDPLAHRKKTTKRVLSKQTDSLMDTVYSEHSFESDHSSHSEEELEDIGIHISRSTTGELKSVKVCCQTLNYWCTCKVTSDVVESEEKHHKE